MATMDSDSVEVESPVEAGPSRFPGSLGEGTPPQSALSEEPHEVLSDGAHSAPRPARSRARNLSLGNLSNTSYAPEMLTTYLEALDLHLPLSATLPLGALRDALLGYLSEAEQVIRERFMLRLEEVEGEEDEHRDGQVAPTGVGVATSDTGVVDISTQEVDSTSSAVSPIPAGSTSYASLRRRGQALKRRLSGSLPPKLSTIPSPEAILNQLGSIREDVVASLPALPQLPSIQIPRTPGLGVPAILSAGVPAFLPAFLHNLPARLMLLNEQVNQTAAIDGERPTGEDDPLSRLARSSNQRRIMALVHSLLPSDQWYGWEKLGWDADEEAEGLMPGHVLHQTEEEPEYFFPFKTPRAVLQRQQSAVYAQESRKRSASLSLRRTKSNGDRSITSKKSVGGSDYAVDDEERQSSHAQAEIDEEEAEELALEIDEETELLLKVESYGPTVQQALEKSQHGNRLIAYDDIPVWMQNNEYILQGYRFIPLDPKFGPVPLILSAFGWHNETINIHSHFIPTIFLLAVVIPYVILYPPLQHPAPLDVLTMLAFLLSASACLLSSAGWHVIAGCSRRSLFEMGACVDYVGISWLICCSIHIVYYNGFYCQGRTLLIYTLTTFSAALAGSYLPFQPWFNERRNKSWRIAVFLGIAFTALAPLTHLAIEHGLVPMLKFAGPIFPSIFAYVAGLLFYAFHWPEARYPGKFDYLGHSHQIWHIAILFGIYLHYAGSLTIFESRHSLSCAQPWAGAPMSSFFRGWFGSQPA